MNLTSCLLILTFIFIVKTSAEKTRYDNYRVYSILVENEQHLKILQDLENSSEDGVSIIFSQNIFFLNKFFFSTYFG